MPATPASSRSASRPRGRKTLATLHAFGRQQVRGALSALSKAERRTVREGLLLYARALEAWRAAEQDMQPSEP